MYSNINKFCNPAVSKCFTVFWKVFILKRATENPPATYFYTVYRNLSDVYKILGGVNYTEELVLFLFIFLQGFLKLSSKVQCILRENKGMNTCSVKNLCLYFSCSLQTFLCTICWFSLKLLQNRYSSIFAQITNVNVQVKMFVKSV